MNLNLKKHYDPDKKAMYERQLEQLANLLLLKDKPYCEFEYNLPVLIGQVNNRSWIAPFTWLNRGELMSGSYMSWIINNKIPYSDIDIYFHCEKDAYEFAELNNRKIKNNVEGICLYTTNNENLIYGIPYSTPEDLISVFDIRACAIAYDPTNNQVISVKEAIGDAKDKVLTFQVGARSYSLNRLLKYVTEKGFTIDSWQRAIFVELIKSSNADKDIELLGTYCK